MATVEQLQGQLADAKNSLQSAIDRVDDDVEALKQRLGDRIDPSELDPISQGLSELKSNLDALDPDPANPPPAA
jgi:outer membrane protein TolC